MSIQVVAGITLKNLPPRVWDEDSPYYLPQLEAVMISYADFHRVASRRHAAMREGLHAHLGIPERVRIYLDNGAFALLGKEAETPRAAYEAFIAQARPDWWPIPQDYIPTAAMPAEQQRQCVDRTMATNLAYALEDYTPVIHICALLPAYLAAVQADARLAAKPTLALGGIVPNLLRAPKALPYRTLLESLAQVRALFQNKQLHVFGIGGTATLHLAALLGMDSVDSSGWRNRAARGIVQLPGRGDRSVAALGSWRGRAPDEQEWRLLATCACPACQQFGVGSLCGGGKNGFCHRATHNMWVLLEESRHIEQHLQHGTYLSWYRQHLDNTIYRPLIEQAAQIWARIESQQRVTDESLLA